MPLTMAQLEDFRDEAMADDLDIDLERMSLWTEVQARSYFESGGEDVPAETAAEGGGKEGEAETPDEARPPTAEELAEDATDAPHVDGCSVMLGSHQDLGCSVVLRDHLLSHVFA